MSETDAQKQSKDSTVQDTGSTPPTQSAQLMTTDPSLAFESQAQWLAHLARHEGWKKYAQERCKELEQDESFLWLGLRHRIKELLDEKTSKPV